MLAEFIIDEVPDDRACLIDGPAANLDTVITLPDGVSKNYADTTELEPPTDVDRDFGTLDESVAAIDGSHDGTWADDDELLTEASSTPAAHEVALTDARQNVEAAFAATPIEASTDSNDASPGGNEAADTTDGDDAATEHAAKAGNGPPDRPGGTNELSGEDNGDLPKRNRRDESELPDVERERILAIGKAHIHHEVSDDGTHTISLPDGNTSTYQVVESETERVATNWRIDINEEQKDLGIGRRIAKETADELIRQGVDRLSFTIDSEAALRTAFTVFDHHIAYTSPDGQTEITTPQQALGAIMSSTEGADVPAGIQATVDMRSFFIRDAAYHTTEDERVIDRCDFANAQADEQGMYGEVHAFRQRLLGLPEPHATNATLAFNEILANYNAHVLPVNPGERYEVRTSWVQDPDTNRSHIRLSNYFFGSVRPGVVDNINYHLSQIGSEEAFFGESREDQGAEVDPEDIDAAATLEQRGDETTAHLQQSGRGLATIKRVCTRAMAVGFPGGGGGFVLDIKDVEVARKPAASEAQVAPDKDDTDQLIADFLKDFPDE